MKRLALLLALLGCTVLAHAAPAALPGDSVYQLGIELTDQDGVRTPFHALRGEPRIITMFYASCQMVCPMIVDSMRQTLQALPADKRSRIGLVAVSFDPARDDVATLKAYAEKRKLAPEIWTLARAESGAARQLSGVLGLQYRQLPDGEFNHSSELIALDAEGRIVARTSRISRLDKEFVAKVEALLDR